MSYGAKVFVMVIVVGVIITFIAIFVWDHYSTTPSGWDHDSVFNAAKRGFYLGACLDIAFLLVIRMLVKG